MTWYFFEIDLQRYRQSINQSIVFSVARAVIFVRYKILYLCSNMSIWRVLLSILFPPLAVIDKGCGSVLIVLILTLLGWIPGVLAALIILNKSGK
jgi:uncharacterized membrane protein YqaE (UPF0057 family)